MSSNNREDSQSDLVTPSETHTDGVALIKEYI